MMQPKDVYEPHEVRHFDIDAFVVSLDGEFDIAERVRLLDAFAVTASAPAVVIDFEKTRYVDSTVLECLVALERTIAERGAKLVLVELRPEIRRIFDVCGLERLFDIRHHLSDATAALLVDSARVRRLTLVAEPATPESFDSHWSEVQ
jgi:anti-sigma B factor antagonist